MSDPTYKVTYTQDYTYISQEGRLINGVRVYFTIGALGENHHVDVPNIDPVTVKTAIEAFVKNRLAL